ncbi:MAG: hypothetical protein MJA31_06095 [Clostridia bacterium]|nr:hypothetical protein [Clostridia bacterium]
MDLKLNLLGLPQDKFKYLMENYNTWIENVEETAFLYIEINRLNIKQTRELVLVLQKNASLDMEKVHQLLDQCLCNAEIKEELRTLYQSNESEEKKWIVYYNHMDVGHRVKAKKYTEALLLAYEKYGADGKITKVEEA